LWSARGWSTFPITSTGKPDNGPDRRETVRKATGSQRETGGGKSQTESRRETGGGRFGPEATGKLEAETSTWSQRETGGIGGRETDGDPSGSSRVNRPQALRLATQPWKRGRERPSGRTAADFGQRRLPERSSVPGRMYAEELRIPERVNASAKTPSGVSRV
jgi:hypothetical protein